MFKGFYVDLLVPSDDPDYKYEVKRVYFRENERSKYKKFVKDNLSVIQNHGERHS